MSTGNKQKLANRSQYDQQIISGQGRDFSAKILLDFYNKRLKLLTYDNRNMAGLDTFLLQVARNHQLDKVLVTANQRDWEEFLERGYVLECMNKYYFNGDPAYHMSKFLSVSRWQSDNLSEEDTVLKLALGENIKPSPPLPEGYTVRPASEEDIPTMVQLFTRVFSTYPSPVYDPDFLLKSIHGSTFYLLVISDHGHIVSTISAEMNQSYGNAEVTDCSTLPEYRGRGLMSAMLTILEKNMREKGILNLYSIARAASTGINIVFPRHAYTYGGRFINNCNIGGGFEDMNLWVKRL